MKKHEWDTPLPLEKEMQWKAWADSLAVLEQVYIQRAYTPISMSCCKCGIVESFELVLPEAHEDIWPQVTCLVTKVAKQFLRASRFERFSVRKSLVRGMACLVHIPKSFSGETKTDRCKGWHQCGQPLTTERSQAKLHIFKAVQEDVYKEELKCLTQGKVQCQGPLAKLDPFIDKSGLIRAREVKYTGQIWETRRNIHSSNQRAIV